MEGDTIVQRLIRPLRTQWIRDVTGVSKQAVSNWRHGRDEPTIAHWDALHASLLVSLPPKEPMPWKS